MQLDMSALADEVDRDLARQRAEALKKAKKEGKTVTQPQPPKPRELVIEKARADEVRRRAEAALYPALEACGLAAQDELLRREMRGNCVMVRALITGDEPLVAIPDGAVESEAAPDEQTVLVTDVSGTRYLRTTFHADRTGNIVTDVFLQGEHRAEVGEAHLCSLCRDRFRGLLSKLFRLSDAHASAADPGRMLKPHCDATKVA